jgi:putative membrane protein
MIAPVSEPTPESSRQAVVDPTRRTYLAEERTMLAWWRSGLTALAVALGVGRFLPAVTHHSRGPFVGLGVGFSVLAVAFIACGTIRQRQVDRALADGRFEPIGAWMILGFTALLLLLGLGTTMLVIWGD